MKGVKNGHRFRFSGNSLGISCEHPSTGSGERGWGIESGDQRIAGRPKREDVGAVPPRSGVFLGVRNGDFNKIKG